MPNLPVPKAVEIGTFENISLVATDVDGTLTRHGKLTSALIAAIEMLAEANISVVLVTGRSAGWVQGLKSYLPVKGAIAENGGVFFSGVREEAECLTAIGNITQHRQQLACTFQQLKQQFPQLAESADNGFRITDWTFDIQDLQKPQLQILENLCSKFGWGFTYSTVQCHIKPLGQEKATSLQRVLKSYFPELTGEQIATVGDSPNDESLFNKNYFPVSVGVANILHYTDRLQHLPTYITTLSEAEGFCELAQLIVKSH